MIEEIEVVMSLIRAKKVIEALRLLNRTAGQGSPDYQIVSDLADTIEEALDMSNTLNEEEAKDKSLADAGDKPAGYYSTEGDQLKEK